MVVGLVPRARPVTGSSPGNSPEQVRSLTKNSPEKRFCSQQAGLQAHGWPRPRQALVRSGVHGLVHHSPFQLRFIMDHHTAMHDNMVHRQSTRSTDSFIWCTSDFCMIERLFTCLDENPMAQTWSDSAGLMCMIWDAMDSNRMTTSYFGVKLVLGKLQDTICTVGLPVRCSLCQSLYKIDKGLGTLCEDLEGGEGSPKSF